MNEAVITIPEDEEAERTVAGCAVATAHGSLLAHQRLVRTDFYVPACRRLFDWSASIGWAMTTEERVATLAVKATVPADEVWRIVRTRCCQHDSAGSFAHRVLTASRRRQLMNACSGAYNALGSGGGLSEAVQLLAETLTEIGADRSLALSGTGQ